jgi:competence protein ComEC
MLAGAATSVAGAVSLDLARPVALLAWAVAFALRVAVEAFASLPFAAVSLPPGPLTGAAVAATEIAAFAIGRRVRFDLGSFAALARRARSVSLPSLALGRFAVPRQGIAALLALAIAPAAAVATWPASSGVRVVALDVGQGDAYLVEIAGAFALIDGGPDPSRVIDELGATLAPWQRRIDLVALTHAHTDHGAGLLAVLDRYDVGVAIEPEGLSPSPLTDLWAAGLAKHSVPRRAVHAGQRLAFGDASIEILAPDPDLQVDVPSLVMRIARGPFSILFTGDAVDPALGRLLERPDRLRSRVYVPPHHGAETPFAGALRTAARPEAALISVGAGNRYGHPTPQTLAALAGIPTYRTDQDGTVEIALDGPGLVVRTHANGLPPPRRGPLPFAPSRQ